MRHLFLNKRFGKHLLIWTLIFSLVQIGLFAWITLLDLFPLFPLFYAIIAAFLSTLAQSFVRIVHNKYIKCIHISFILYLISTSIILPYAVLVEFMKIEIGRSPTMFSLFVKGFSFTVKEALYVFVVSYTFMLLTYSIYKRRRNKMQTGDGL
jgi:hypothetical protein